MDKHDSTPSSPFLSIDYHSPLCVSRDYIVPIRSNAPDNFPTQLVYSDTLQRTPSLTYRGRMRPDEPIHYGRVSRVPSSSSPGLIRDLALVASRGGRRHPAWHSEKRETYRKKMPVDDNSSDSDDEYAFFPASSFGLFASSDLAPGQPLFIYSGVESSRGEPRIYPRGVNYFVLSSLVEICAERVCNESRFMNDYRGLMREPNVEFHIVLDEQRKENNIIFVANRWIYEGEELLVDYGDEYFSIESRAKMANETPFYELEWDS